MLLIIVILVCWVYSTTGTLTCYSTEKDCLAGENHLARFPKEIVIQCSMNNGLYSKYECPDSTHMEEHLGCSSGCNGCTTINEYGDCEQWETGSSFCRVSGCSASRDTILAILYSTGLVFMLLGLIGCICCCWIICCPLGIMFIWIGCCVMRGCNCAC